ncbi:multicopper oxidase domain-containing protein, partial [Pyxidicoccus fallax]
PTTLRPVERLDERSAVATRTLTFTGAMNPIRFMVNGRTYEHHRTDLTVKADTLEVWELRNPSPMDHPFHLHVFPFQVLTRDGVPAPFPAWRDVINLRAGETVRIAVPFREHTGDVMLHCHIVEHEDRGMMANVRVTRD